jgi:hypothetical protein
MNFNYKHLLDGNFHPDSRVWVYQCNRVFTLNEALEIEEMLSEFKLQWNSHGSPVKGELHLLFGRFIVIIADETATTVGGCSTDSSVRLIKEIEKRFGVNMFDRQALAFILNDTIQLLPLSQLQYATENGFIKNDTLYFNNLVQSKKELEESWIIPVAKSWLAARVPIPT